MIPQKAKSGAVSLWLGRLLLTFVFVGALAAETQPGFFRKDIFFSGNSLAVGDFDGDGKPDLAVGGEGGVNVLLNSGNGSFGQAVVTKWLSSGQLPSFDTNPRYLSTADFNRDGKADLIVTLADPLGVMIVMLGRGDGTFLPPKQGELDLGPAVAGDFDSDGTPDLVTAYSSVWLGNGDGTFRQGQSWDSVYLLGVGPVVADFNRDGKVDIASGCCNSPVLVFLGRGDGTFQRPVVSAMLASYLWVADLNRDGLPDLITQSGAALGKGDGSFEPLVPFAIPGATRGMDPPHYDPFAVADFTGDGTADVAMRLPNGVAICPGMGDGTFGPPVKHTVGGIHYSAASADLDGDGRPDVATLNHLPPNNESNTITLLLSGTGNTDSLARAVSAASGTAIVAPESLATIFNSFPVAVPEAAGAPPWPVRLAGLTLEVRDSAGTGRLAPLLYVSESQINFLVPADTALGEAALVIAGNGGSNPGGTMQVDAVAPGVFPITGRFQAPAGGGAADDRVVSVYATGFRGPSLLNIKCAFLDLVGAFNSLPCVIERAGPEGKPGLNRIDILVPAWIVRHLANPSQASFNPLSVVLSIEGISANAVPLRH